MIAESLALADELGLGLVGIALDGALSQLACNGMVIEADEGVLH